MSYYPDFSAFNYQIECEIGCNREGGRITYLAHFSNSSQQVVIKQFRFVQLGSSWQGFKAHKREIAILKKLNHPRIPRYLDSFETNDGFCIVQEYKDAPSLASKNCFQPEKLKHILISILEILVEIQTSIPIIIHRDIKPENILVDDENNAYLIDFGLARVNSQELAMSSVLAGTPGFMPPEELFNRPLTTASDLYSLGVTAIVVLTNTPSAKISNLIDESYKFNFSHLVTGINPNFINWLEKMVELNPRDRYNDAASALKELVSINIQGKAELEASNYKSISTVNYVYLIIFMVYISIIFTIFRPYSLSNLDTKSNQPDSNNFYKEIPESSKSNNNNISRAINKSNRSINNNIHKKNTKSRQSTFKDVYKITKSIPEKASSSVSIPHSKISDSIQAQDWFYSIKSSCNSEEVDTAIAKSNSPQTPAGVGYAASCYILAERLDLADKVIQELPSNLRIYAASVIFYEASFFIFLEINLDEIGYSSDFYQSHFELANKAMEIVLKYWPDNRMAKLMPLYSAGMVAYMTGEYSQSTYYLQQFLSYYHDNDGWKNQAQLVALCWIVRKLPYDDKKYHVHVDQNRVFDIRTEINMTCNEN